MPTNAPCMRGPLLLLCFLCALGAPPNDDAIFMDVFSGSSGSRLVLRDGKIVSNGGSGADVDL